MTSLWLAEANSEREDLTALDRKERAEDVGRPTGPFATAAAILAPAGQVPVNES